MKICKLMESYFSNLGLQGEGHRKPGDPCWVGGQKQEWESLKRGKGMLAALFFV